MKIVNAVIKPSKLDEVKEALVNLGFTDLTITEVKAFSLKGQVEIYRSAEYIVNFPPMVEITVAVQDGEKADDAAQAISKAAWTGKGGDGRIVVVKVDKFLNIDTGENEAEVANDATRVEVAE